MSMPTHRYRATLLLCVAAWFLVGMHAPVLHQITHHDRMPSWPVLAALLLMAAVGAATLWRLLRAPAAGAPGPGTAAT